MADKDKFTFDITYQKVKNPPAAMSWDDYSKKVIEEWRILLDQEPLESKIQTFLEKHPSMVPGAFGMIGTSGHSPYPGALISKPVLPEFTRRVPDFMWIALTSCTIEPILIEIESPSKKWWQKNDETTTADFNQARSQLADWRTWFSEPLNIENFKKHYQIPSYLTRDSAIKPHYVLIYGRRTEADKTSAHTRKRDSLVKEDESIMTFDRLRPDPNCKDLFCTQIKKDGYHAISMPATLELSPSMAKYHQNIKDRTLVADANEWLNEERKQFVKKRFAYWDSWALSADSSTYDFYSE